MCARARECVCVYVSVSVCSDDPANGTCGPADLRTCGRRNSEIRNRLCAQRQCTPSVLRDDMPLADFMYLIIIYSHARR